MGDTSEMNITESTWGTIPWQFIAQGKEPDIELCTAAFCIVTYRGKLLLVEHNTRGYEFAGGHIDPDENITTTVIREVREESRAIIQNPQFFGYKKISPPHPIPHRDKPNHFYPFPHSYIPYYFAEAVTILDRENPTSDIKSVRLANYEEAFNLLQPGQNHEKILEYLVSQRLIDISMRPLRR